MINPDLIKAGDELWDVHRYKMGNTTCRAMGSWRVNVLSVDRSEYGVESAMCSWNGNRPERFYPGRIRRLRRSPYQPRERKA